jgi:hypothetical protein
LRGDGDLVRVKVREAAERSGEKPVVPPRDAYPWG